MSTMLFYGMLGLCAGAVAAWGYRLLPERWLCDYNEVPQAQHAAQRRKLPLWAIAAFALGTALCAGCIGAQANMLIGKLAGGVALPPLPPLQMAACALLTACLVAGLLLAALCDAQYTILPDQLLLCAGALVLALWALGGLRAVHGIGYDVLLGALLGFFGLLLVLLVASKIYKTDAMGYGDVKLLAVLGAFCGPRALGVAVLVAVLVGGAVLGTLVACGKLHRRSTVAFGPFLVAGALGAVCLWPQWCALGAWYLGLFGL